MQDLNYSRLGLNPLIINNLAYNSLYREYAKRTEKFSIPKQFKDFSNTLPFNKVVDVGCGPGRDVLIMIKCGFEVLGIDTSQKMIKYAKKQIKKYFSRKNNFNRYTRNSGTSTRSLDKLLDQMFYQASMQEIHLDDPLLKPKSFGGIWAVSSLQHVPYQDLPRTLHNFNQLLAKNGMLYIKTRAPFDNHKPELYECVQTSTENGKPFSRFFSYYEPDYVLEQLKNVGFDVIKMSNGKQGKIKFKTVVNGNLPGYKFWILAKKI